MDWESRYRDYGRVFGDDPTPFLQEAFPEVEKALKKRLRVFCPGDGYGRNGLWIARRGHSVEGIDLSPFATELANSQALREGLDYQSHTGNLNDEVPLGPYDCIAHMWCYLDDAKRRMAWNKKACSSLADNGFVVLTTSSRLTTPETEISEWPKSIDWEVATHEKELRLLGKKSA